jgi:hypothetical protein
MLVEQLNLEHLLIQEFTIHSHIDLCCSLFYHKYFFMYILQVYLVNKFFTVGHIALTTHIIIVIFLKHLITIAVELYIIHNILIQPEIHLDITLVTVLNFFIILFNISLIVHHIFFTLLQLDLYHNYFYHNFLLLHKVMHHYIFKVKKYLIFN